MTDILHRVGIAAEPIQVYELLSTKDGLTTWWTTEVDGLSAVGAQLSFFFGRPEPSAVMEVTELSSERRVRWRCVGGPEDWVGTNVSFEIRPDADEAVLLFEHRGWREPSEFMHHCSTKWAYFLLTIKAGLEGNGKFTPYPHDLPLGKWR